MIPKGILKKVVLTICMMLLISSADNLYVNSILAHSSQSVDSDPGVLLANSPYSNQSVSEIASGVEIGQSNVSSISDDIVLRYSFSFPIIEHVGEYDRVSIEGLNNFGEPGTPLIPFKTARILLPPDKRLLSVEAFSMGKVQLYGEFKIEPGVEPVPLSSTEKYDKQLNQTIYSSSEPYPSKLYNIVSIQSLKGYQILVLNLYPIQYIPCTGTIFSHSSIEVTVKTAPASTSQNSLEKEAGKMSVRAMYEDREQVRGVVDNPWMMDAYETLARRLTRLYDYVVITDESLKSSFQPLVDWKNTKGVTSTIVTIQQILGNYTGYDIQEKIRNFIIDAYSNWGIRYVLLGGDDEIIPHRGLSAYDDTDIASDLYYACLDGNWDNNGNHVYGEAGEEDFYAEVYVGRAPVNTPVEASVFVNKTITYERDRPADYLSNSLMLAAMLDGSTDGGIVKDLIESILPPSYLVTKLYERDSTASVESTTNELNAGQHIVNNIGHANNHVIGLACVNYAAYYTEADVDALENGPKFFLIYTIGCYANAFDNRDPGGNYVGDAISEHFINNPNGGAFAFIGNSRYGWYSPGHPGEGPSNRYDIEFFDAIYVEGIRHIGAALQDSKEDLAGLAGNEIMKWVYYTLNLLGDPETELVLLPPPEHEISVQDMEAPDWLQPLETSMINATICDYGLNNETNVSVDFMVDGVVVDNQTIPFLANGTSVQVSFNWAAPTLERAYNITIYAEPVPGENITINNARTKTIQVVEIAGHIKAVVLDSYGTDFNISTWEKLNSKWYQYGDTLIHIDYTTLNINDITYSDIAATNADVLVISCAYMWEFTDSEIDAITHYVLEGHGLIATAGTFYLGVPNNNKLAQLFGLSDAITWDATGTDSLDILELTHPLFANIPNPYTMPYRGTAIPSDWAWDSNELVDGTYVALGDSLESAIVVRNGLVFISPWVENTPTNDDLQLLYNAITWSRYEIPEHEVHVKTDKDWYSSNEPIIITTNVTRRETPVTGANVTAFITVPEDVLIGTLTLHDDGTHGDIVQDDGIYTNTFPGIRSGNSTGTYKVTVRATILDYDVEEGEADFIFIGDNNLLVRVLNTLNEPAPYVYLNVLDQSTGSIVRWWYLADENGIYCTTLPEGLYAVMAWSGRDYRYRTGRTDNFFLIDEDLDVSNNMVVVVLLNATAGVPVLLQTSNINEEPEGYFYVDLYPAVGGFGLEVAYTNSSGEAVIYTTPSLYHIAVRKYATPSYYLYKLNVDCTNPRTVAFQPAVTTTSNLTLSLQRVARDQYGWGWIHPTSLPSPFGFGFGDEVIVTPDEWEVWGGNTYIMPQNGYWYYDLWCEPARIFNITIPRSSATFHFGGTLQFTLSAGESYDPGDVVPIYWNLTDSFGNIVEGIYESTEHISEPTFVTNTGLRKTQILNATGIPQPIAYREHRPYLIIIDPEDSPLVNTDVYWWEKPKQYELSADAINGVYTAEMSVYTGPWQNTIAVSDIFTVGNASPSIGWISAWVYPDNYWLVTGGDVARGKTLRIYSGVSDAETPSQDLTVSISYRPQGGEWTTTQASYNPTWDYWYIDWTIPGGATLGLYDVKVDASDPNGGSVSSTVLSQFKVV